MSSHGAPWRLAASTLAAPLQIIDVGARAGIDEAWSALAPNVQAYGFEPDVAESARLNKSAAHGIEYVPVALWRAEERRPFYVTEDPMCSSLYAPCEWLTRERPRLGLVRTREQTTIAVRTLDGWARERGLERFDYLKLDAQGAELAIIEGAGDLLGGVRALKIEVQFSPQYEGVPPFGEVDLQLRERGFVLWRLSELSHCGFADGGRPEIPEHCDYDDQRVQFVGGAGQLLWGDAYFVRNETVWLSREVHWEDAIRDACLAWVHGYVDLATVSLQRAASIAPAPTQELLQGALDAFGHG